MMLREHTPEDIWLHAQSRLRAGLLRLLGMTIGKKTAIGRRTRFDRRKQISIASRVTIEDEVWLKLVSSCSKLTIGEHSFIGRNTEIDVSDQVEIGKHVLIGPGVFITDHNHNIRLGLRIDEQGCSSSPVIIGNDVWLGANVVVLPGVVIGSGAVVGAGAVVNRSLPENSVSVGVPAKPIRLRH